MMDLSHYIGRIINKSFFDGFELKRNAVRQLPVDQNGNRPGNSGLHSTITLKITNSLQYPRIHLNP